jgi:hypothetical protein
MSVVSVILIVRTKEMRNKMNKETDFQTTTDKGFNVLEARDGYRNDNSLWFGICSVCGDRVTNSALKGEWEHELILNIEYHTDGTIFTKTSRQIDYCPAV